MDFAVHQIMSHRLHGAVSSLLVINHSIFVLLDCGINSSFNLQQYEKYRQTLKKVKLALISHSSLQFSGAYPFLISQFEMDPKIFFTTQPIMRYSPLNLHQSLLNYRFQMYDKEIFNKIYSFYQQMHLVKPYQKKQISLQLNQGQGDSIALPRQIKVIQFVCYPAGGNLGSICWKISFGIVSIVYLIEYNNYSLFHIAGLDIEALRSQRTHIMITDAYKDNQIQKSKENLTAYLRSVILTFYQKNMIDHAKPKPIIEEDQPKLLFVCTPNEMMIEIMVAVRKILNQLQGVGSQNCQKIGVIHLSSRFLQLIKSQSEYFSADFKSVMDKYREYFDHSLRLFKRINIATAGSLSGILQNSLKRNVQIHHLGKRAALNLYQIDQQTLFNMNLFTKRQILAEDAANQDKMIDENEPQPILKKQSLQRQSIIEKPVLVGRYISQIDFPHFIFTQKEQDYQTDDYGLRNHSQFDTRPVRKQIYQVMQKQEQYQINLTRKQSKIQIMNIQFKIPDKTTSFDPLKLASDNYNIEMHRTGFSSSVEVINILNPVDIVFINSNQQEIRPYQNRVKKSKIVEPAYGIFRMTHLNDLLQYQVNYLPGLQLKKIQKVKGVIEQINGSIHIHLDCLEEPQILEFKMEIFYKQAKRRFTCAFNEKGVIIDGIQILRAENSIILKGEYSEKYFKVRKFLYDFLQIV